MADSYESCRQMFVVPMGDENEGVQGEMRIGPLMREIAKTVAENPGIGKTDLAHQVSGVKYRGARIEAYTNQDGEYIVRRTSRGEQVRWIRMGVNLSIGRAHEANLIYLTSCAQARCKRPTVTHRHYKAPKA